MKIWHADTGQEELVCWARRISSGALPSPPTASGSPAGGQAGLVQVWNAHTGEKLLLLKGHSLPVRSVQFSPDGRQIATSSADRTAKVWEADTGRELLALEGHTGGIASVRFFPDSRRILTAGDDNMVKVWDASTGRELLSLRCQTDSTSGLALSPDGRTIMRATSGKTLQVWIAASQPEIEAWREEERPSPNRSQHAQDARKRPTSGNVPSNSAEKVQSPGGWSCHPSSAGAGDAERLAQQHLPNESQIHPSAGDRVRVGDQELAWRDVQLTNYVIEL